MLNEPLFLPELLSKCTSIDFKLEYKYKQFISLNDILKKFVSAYRNECSYYFSVPIMTPLATTEDPPNSADRDNYICKP